MSDGLHRSCAGPGRVEGGVQPSPPPQFRAGEMIRVEVDATIPRNCMRIGDEWFRWNGPGIYRWTGGNMPRANRNEGGIGITGTAQVQGDVPETSAERMRRGLREMIIPEVGTVPRARPAIDHFAIDPGDPYEEWATRDTPDTYTRRRREATAPDQVIYESTSGFRVRYGERDGEGYFLFGAYGDDVVLTPSNTVAMARALVEFFQQKYGGEPCNENEDSVAGQSSE